MISAASCSSLDNIISALYREIQRRQKHPNQATPENRSSLLRIYEMQPQLFQQLMTTILRIVMFEEARNHWALSRPLLGLILLCDRVCSNPCSAFSKIPCLIFSTFKNYNLELSSLSRRTSGPRWPIASRCWWVALSEISQIKRETSTWFLGMLEMFRCEIFREGCRQRDILKWWRSPIEICSLFGFFF